MNEEEFNSKFDDIESEMRDLDYRIEKTEWKIYDLEMTNIKGEQYQIYFYPTTIKKYILDLKRYQEKSKFKYFPTSKEEFKNYFGRFNKFEKNDKVFNSELIKYSDSDNFDLVSYITANQGSSGFNFLQMVDQINELNKPVLLFYGIEQLSAFFVNMHFNFTNSNQWENSIKNRKLRVIRNHGIGANQFENIEISKTKNIIKTLLMNKISLKKMGLSSRFFSIFKPNSLNLFTNEEKISFKDLLINFFILQREADITGNDYISIPKEIKDKFKDYFDSRDVEIHLRSATLTIYLISFLFAYLSRYKMYLWKKLLTSNQLNISFFVKFILKYSKDYFIQFLFNRLKYYEERGKGLIPKFFFIDQLI